MTAYHQLNLARALLDRMDLAIWDGQESEAVAASDETLELLNLLKDYGDPRIVDGAVLLMSERWLSRNDIRERIRDLDEDEVKIEVDFVENRSADCWWHGLVITIQQRK